MSCPGARYDRGYTLIEIVVVLAMIALATSALNFAVRQVGHDTNPRDIARQIANEARSAALRAISTGQSSTLRIDLSKRVVTVDEGTPKISIPAHYAVVMKAGEQPVDTGKTGVIEFFPNGSSSGGEITIDGARAGGYAVRVFWLTGEISTRRLQ